MAHKKRRMRVKFYPWIDLAAGFHATRAIEILDKYSNARTIDSIVDAIELYNAGLYISEDIFPAEITEEDKKRYRKIVKSTQQKILGYIGKNFTSESLPAKDEFPHDYKHDLLFLLGKAGVYKRSFDEVVLLLENLGVRLPDLAACEMFVKNYDQAVRELFLADYRSAELILDNLRAKVGRKVGYYIPRSLTGEERASIIARYIESEDMNTNYLSLIMGARVIEEYGITARNKANATRAYDAFWNSENENIQRMKYDAEVIFSDDAEFESRHRTENGIETFEYSFPYVSENLETESILNHLQHLFEIVNDQVIIHAVAKVHETGIIESFTDARPEGSYLDNLAFHSKQVRELAKIVAFEQLLIRHNVRIEEAIADYVNRIIPQDFGIKGFHYAASSKESTWQEKTLHICTQLEALAAQFKMFVTEGEIDSLILQYDSNKLDYETIGSLIPGKYLYPEASSELPGILFSLFSSQSRLDYVENEKGAGKFIELLVRKELKINDFADFQVSLIKKLISLKVLKEEKGLLKFCTDQVGVILMMLFFQGVVAKHRLDEQYIATVEEMVSKGWLVAESTLLAKPEADFYSYWLNNAKFPNARALRNKYAHGRHVPENEKECETDYYTVLRLLVSLVIKINDELVTRFPDPKIRS